MSHEKPPTADEPLPWLGVALLYLMVTPFALLAFLAFRSFGLVWNQFDASVGAKYAASFFGISGCLLSVFVIMVVRHIYVEFVAPRFGLGTNHKQR